MSAQLIEERKQAAGNAAMIHHIARNDEEKAAKSK